MYDTFYFVIQRIFVLLLIYLTSRALEKCIPENE